MRKILVSLAMILLAALTTNAQEISTAVVDKTEAEKWRADLHFMAEQMPKYHRNLFHTMTREQFTSAIEDLDRRIPGLARHQIIVEIARIVALVGDGHANVAPTRDPKIGFHTLPIKLYFLTTACSSEQLQKNMRILLARRLCRLEMCPSRRLTIQSSS
jgi:hypothetical protein